MKTFQKIERKKGESTGVVRYLEDGTPKGARFDARWSDAAVLKYFGIEKTTGTKEGAK